MLAAQTIRNPNKRSCKLLRGISMAIRERPKLVWIEVFHPARPYCSPKAMQKRINTPLITRVANIRDAHSFAVICLFFPCFVVRISTSVFMLYSLEKTIDTAIILTSRAGMAIVRVEPQKLIKKNSQLSLYPYCKAVPTSGI